MLRVIVSKCSSKGTRKGCFVVPWRSHFDERLLGRWSIRGLASAGGSGGGGDDDGGNSPASTGKKFNFDRKILQPAQKGILPGKHSSKIPRLMARKNKAHLTPIGGRAGHRGPPPTEMDDFFEVGEDGQLINLIQGGEGRGGGGKHGGAGRELSPLEKTLRYVTEDYDPYFAFELMDDKKYYWREEEHEQLIDKFDDSILFGEDGEGTFEIEYTNKDYERSRLLDESMAEELDQLREELLSGGISDSDDDLDDIDDDMEEMAEGQLQERPVSDPYGMDPEEWFFTGSNDILNVPLRDDLPDELDDFGPPPELRKEIVDLNPYHGTGVDGFLQAMAEHPTEYARVSLLKQHPAMLREPKPDFPKYRQPHPPLEFVESFKRFLYVTGLPPLTVNGEEGDLNNPVHRSWLEKTVAGLLNVDSTAVWPVNTTSAFVGFLSPRQMADALKAGPAERALSKLPTISLLSDVENAKNPFSDTEANCVVQLAHTPPGNSPSSLLSKLFPSNTELETAHGSVLDPAKDVYFLSSTKVLLRFQSAEQAASLVTSAIFEERLADVCLYPVRVFRARRELVHGGFTGPINDDEVRIMGPRLIVDGDMPSKEFFLSHPRCIHVRGLDPFRATPQTLNELFQPYCEFPRQLGSIERVVCEAGIPTDRAYVGFDQPGEAEKCIRECNGRMKVGDRWLTLRLVQDRIVPHSPLHRPEKRPARTEEELWDDLNNWEKYVDPADIEYLDKNGVPKVVLDEALRKIRRQNPTFGALDNALRSEAIEPEKSPGELWKELVVLYVQTLKECVATPDDVGMLYEAIHMPDEPIDLSIFDEWEKKKAEIEAARTRP